MAAADPISPIAPARVRVLLLPVGRINKPSFDSFAAQLQSQFMVRLGDVSHDTRPDRSMFSPQAFPEGRVIFDFSSSLPPASLLRSSTVELFREVFLVVGIADGGAYAGFEGENTNTMNVDIQEDIYELQESMGRVREQFPKALSLNLVLFNVKDSSPFQHLPAGTLTVPPLAYQKPTTLKTVMCDITSMLLAEMAVYARNILNLQSLEALSVTAIGHGSHPQRPWSSSQNLDGSATDTPSDGLSRPTTPVANGISGASRTSTPLPRSPPFSSTGAPNGSRRDSTESASSPPVSNLHSVRSNESSTDEPISKRASQIQHADASRETSRDRKSILGQGLSNAGDRAKNQLKTRQGIIIGTLYLHAGRWHDALRELVDSTTRARASSDHLWHAKGLENILVAMLLLAWTDSDFQVPSICYATSEKTFTSMMSISSRSDDASKKSSQNGSAIETILKDVSALIPDLLNMIMNIHVRGLSSKGECLPQFAFSECSIRFANLLSILYLQGTQLSRSSLEHIATCSRLEPEGDATPLARPRAITKQEISALLFRAMPALQPGSEVSVSDALIIYCGMARVLSLIDLPRKRAFVIRKIILDLIPGLVQARKVGAAEAGIHPAAGLAALDALNTGDDSTTSTHGGRDVGQQIKKLLEGLCRVYGIVSADEQAHGPISLLNGADGLSGDESRDTEPASEKYTQDCVRSIIDDSILHSFGGSGLKKDILQLCGNLCEALPDFEGLLRYSAAFLKTVGPGTALKDDNQDWTVDLPREDQLRLASKISRTIGAAKTAKVADIECRYWDDFLIRGLSIAEHDKSMALTQHTPSELGLANRTRTIAKTQNQSPFIYDPFAKAAAKRSNKSVVVHGEATTFIVALQNIYEFELAVEEIQIISEGATVSCSPQSFTVGPYRIHHQNVVGTALASGEMQLIGCKVKIRGCKEQEFLLFKLPWSAEADNKLKSAGLAASRPYLNQPQSGSSESWDQSPTLMSPPTPYQVPITIIRPQPLLAITSTNIAQSTFMILEGETKSLFVTVQNLSEDVAVDFVHVSSSDSTLALLEARLKNKLTSAELYEVEYQAAHQAIRWRRPPVNENTLIAPGASAVFEIEIYGKAGLTDASLRIDYASLGIPTGELEGDFYTRHVLLPVVVTVNACVQLQKIELLPMSSDLAWSETIREHLPLETPDPSSSEASVLSRTPEKVLNPSKASFQGIKLEEDHNGYFLLLLELRNAWPRPLSMSIEVIKDSGESTISPEVHEEGYIVHEHVQPGQAARVAVVLPRMLLKTPIASIPLLKSTEQKQFVVTPEPQSTAESAERLAFWYREELLRKLKAVWKDPSGSNHGKIELRGLRLSPRMLEIMRQDILRIDFDLKAAKVKVGGMNRFGPLSFRLRTNIPVTLKIRLHNRSSRTVRPIVRLQPRLSSQPYNVALDLSRRLAWTGLLQRLATRLGPDEGCEIHFDFCVLCSGTYEIGLVVHDVQSGEMLESLGTDRLFTPYEPLLGRSLCTLTAKDE